MSQIPSFIGLLLQTVYKTYMMPGFLGCISGGSGKQGTVYWVLVGGRTRLKLWAAVCFSNGARNKLGLGVYIVSWLEWNVLSHMACRQTKHHPYCALWWLFAANHLKQVVRPSEVGTGHFGRYGQVNVR